MPEITVTFDPDNMFTTSDFAKSRGITTSAAHAWLNRHAEELPPPAFTLRKRRTSAPDMFIKYWHARDGEEILRISAVRSINVKSIPESGRRALINDLSRLVSSLDSEQARALSTPASFAENPTRADTETESKPERTASNRKMTRKTLQTITGKKYPSQADIERILGRRNSSR
jgi:hypothetical protein